MPSRSPKPQDSRGTLEKSVLELTARVPPSPEEPPFVQSSWGPAPHTLILDSALLPSLVFQGSEPNDIKWRGWVDGANLKLSPTTQLQAPPYKGAYHDVVMPEQFQLGQVHCH